MGQIKNIKLIIVTDIKVLRESEMSRSSSSDSSRSHSKHSKHKKKHKRHRSPRTDSDDTDERSNSNNNSSSSRKTSRKHKSERRRRSRSRSRERSREKSRDRRRSRSRERKRSKSPTTTTKPTSGWDETTKPGGESGWDSTTNKISLKEKIKLLTGGGSASTKEDSFVPTNEQIAKIEDENFVQEKFSATYIDPSNMPKLTKKQKKKNKQKQGTGAARIGGDVEMKAAPVSHEDAMFGAMFYDDPELRKKRWITKLSNLRKKFADE